MKFQKRTFHETLAILLSKREELKKKDGKINVTAAAKAMDLNQSALKRMLDGESGQPNIENGEKITSFLQVTRDQLIGKKPVEWIDGVSQGAEDELSNSYFLKLIGPMSQDEKQDLSDYLEFRKSRKKKS